jgi:hypothetical protein
LVHFICALLAAGFAGTGVVSRCLAVVAAATTGRHHDAGIVHVDSDDFVSASTFVGLAPASVLKGSDFSKLKFL